MPQTTRELAADNGLRFGLTIADRARQADRLNRGLDASNYGPTNHLKYDYDTITELLEELDDAFIQAGGIGPRRAREARADRLAQREMVFGGGNRWIDLCQHIACAIRLCHALRNEQTATPEDEV